MKRSLALLTYSALTSACRPLVPLLLRMRILRGKEDAARRGERLGMATRPMSREEYRRYVAQEIERWAGHVKAAKIEPQ